MCFKKICCVPYDIDFTCTPYSYRSTTCRTLLYDVIEHHNQDIVLVPMEAVEAVEDVGFE